MHALATRLHRDQSGIAVIAAIIICMMVAGLLTVFFLSTLGRTQQGRVDDQRAKALYWVEGATADLDEKLNTMIVGKRTAIPDASPFFQWWEVPTGVAGVAGYNWDAQQAAFRVDTDNGVGWYRIMPIMPGAPANTGLYNQGTTVQNQGEVRFRLQGWGNTADARPRQVEVTFRKGSLARFSLLSDTTITFNDAGSSPFSGSLHANNVGNRATAINLNGQGIGGGGRISSTRGAIINSPTCPARCDAGTGKRIRFESVDKAFNHVNNMSAKAGIWCSDANQSLACVVPPAPAGPATMFQSGLGTTRTVPMYRVRVWDRCIDIRPIYYPARRDAGNALEPDDRFRPRDNGGVSRICTPVSGSGVRGGGAVLFRSSIQVYGVPTAPVTIMAQSSNARQPASIYLAPLGGSRPNSNITIGSASDRNPLGLVSQGSIFIPSWTIPRAGRTFSLRNVAMVAKDGELSLGPMTLAQQGSMDPCAANRVFPGNVNAPGNPAAGTLRIRGSIMARRQPITRYGDATCSVGFTNRNYGHVQRLVWDAPPFFPTDVNWHVAQWREVPTQ